MHIHLTGLLQIVRSLDSFCLSTNAAIDLLRGVSAIIGYLPHEQALIFIHHMLNLIFSIL